jgi:hypothetical protein
VSKRPILSEGYWLYEADNGRLKGGVIANITENGKYLRYTLFSGNSEITATDPVGEVVFPEQVKLWRVTKEELFLLKLKGEV